MSVRDTETDSDVTTQRLSPLALREFLDRTAKHGPWHRAVVHPKEDLLLRSVAIAHFALHPAHRFVNQVVGVVKQQGRHVQRRIGAAVLDPPKGRHNSDPAFPERVGPRESLEHIEPISIERHTYDVVGGGVDQIPVVDIARVREIRPEGGGSAGTVGTRELLYQDEQSKKPFFATAAWSA